MNALDALLTRNSVAVLTEPAPQGDDRQKIFSSALRAPDHAQLRPWRFLCVEGEARAQFGQRMLDAAIHREKSLPDNTLDDKKRTKLLNAPFRAPLVVVSVAKIQLHPKVPEIEQWLSAGAAITQMLVAAHALGFAGIWRTGDIAFDRYFMKSIGLADDEVIVGFLYLGSLQGQAKKLKPLAIDDYFENWPRES